MKHRISCQCLVSRELGNQNRENVILPYLTSMGFWRSDCLVWGVVRVAGFWGIGEWEIGWWITTREFPENLDQKVI